jgi:predicted ATPase/class 3 adenylate cyclase
MDVAGSTSLIQGLDPEDNLAIMDTALGRLAVPVDQHGGRVTRYTGDGLMALFGHPTAHENDPEMAVRAGLAMIATALDYAQEVAAQWGIAGFNVRVGVNTGFAIIGGQTEGEDTLAGAAVNLAARLESAAPVGGLLISQATYQHVRGRFAMEPQEPVVAKGFDKPVPAYLVKSAVQRSFGLSGRGVEGVSTRMIGRDAELSGLMDAFESVVEVGECRTVTVIGDAGLGKSRLIYEFRQRLAATDLELEQMTGRALLETQGRPYELLRDLLESRFKIHDDDTADGARAKFVEGFCRPFGSGDEENRARAHITGHLLGYDFGESPHVKQLLADPKQLLDEAQSATVDYFTAAAETMPIVVLLEDAHWADDSSLDLFTHLAQNLAGQPILFVVITRPILFESRPDWGKGEGSHRRLHLHPLSKSYSRRLVEEVLQKVESVPDALREMVVSSGEGNPFYVEELIKLLIEDGVIVKTEPLWQVHLESLAEVRVPGTLTGVLQARLDSLSEVERRLLQQASVVGRVFWDAVLTSVNRADETLAESEIDDALAALNGREMVFQQEASTFVDAREHIFKHAILRDVTYESVLHRLRRTYHDRVADWLIENSGGRAAQTAGLIALHLEKAGRTGEAVGYLVQAGQTASQLSAHTEAAANFARALTLLDELPPGEERDRQEFIIQLNIGRIEEAARGIGSHDAGVAYSRALALGRQLGDADSTIQVLLALTQHAAFRSEHALAQSYGEEGQRLAAEIQDPELLMLANASLIFIALALGQYNRVMAYSDDVIEYYRGRQANLNPGEISSLVFTLGLNAIALVPAGFPDRALRRAQDGIAIAEEHENRYGETTALGMMSSVYSRRREWEEMLRYGEQQRSRSEMYDFFLNRTYGQIHVGVATAMRGDVDEGIAMVRQAFHERDQMGVNKFQGGDVADLACAFGRVGRVAEALDLINEGLAEMEASNDRQHESQMCRIKGDLLLMQELPLGELESAQREAENCFRRAIEVARAGAARLWEARALASLCRLLDRQGRGADCRRELAQLFDWFTEGFEVEDLQVVRSVLEETA